MFRPCENQQFQIHGKTFLNKKRLCFKTVPHASAKITIANVFVYNQDNTSFLITETTYCTTVSFSSNTATILGSKEASASI